MAVGLPNWWHSIALLAILFSCSVKVQLSFAIAIEHPFLFGPLPSPHPEPPPEPPPESPPILTPPLPYSSFFNLTPPVPDFHLLPSNHNRSLYMPAQHNRIPVLTEPISSIDGYYPISYFSGSILPNQVDYYPARFVVPEISQIDPAESVEYKSYWEYLRPASPITSIVQQVLANYKSHESPDENNSDPTTVTVSVHILAVASINVIQMEYTVDLYLRQQWVDSRLAWERVPHLAHYKDYVLLTAHKQRLWLPDLFFRNGKRGYRHAMSVPNDLIRVHPNGSVLYSQKITMILSCSMYLHLYPMDHQECQMNIGSYGYTVDELKFVWRQDNPVTVAEKLQLLEFDSPRSASTKVSPSDGSRHFILRSKILFALRKSKMSFKYLTVSIFYLTT
ncbi:Glycine receptor subunit alpha-2 [Fasciola gigantica]|uniref:Glycine receptor subunit alpha-2 n=1 Tax=Fasciola gigantica TaxID=46835 RepID=A0A504YYX7_FASGI|nr:Glycine receptor subunit alpha-2 [Fasciola gigantica]